MNRAHSKGVAAALSCILLAAPTAIGFQHSTLFWCSFLVAPLIFQFVSGRSWRALRPRIMLEYLAARTAARRYAYVVKASNLSLKMVFRGELEHIFEEEDVLGEMEASLENLKNIPVWVALFGDAVIMMSERYGGAELQFGHVLNDKISIEASSPSGGGEYAQDREMTFEYVDKLFGRKKIKLRSQHFPAAMVVFEKETQQIHARAEELKKAALDQIGETDGLMAA